MQMSISKRRHDAYLQVFDENSMSHELIIDVATSADEARQRVFLAFSKNEKPQAVFCMSDEILIGAMKAIQMMELKVPDEVAVISISNGFFPKLYHPEITYVETSGYKLGKLAFTRMIDYIQGKQGRRRTNR